MPALPFEIVHLVVYYALMPKPVDLTSGTCTVHVVSRRGDCDSSQCYVPLAMPSKG